jgi:hypothetical protein
MERHVVRVRRDGEVVEEIEVDGLDEAQDVADRWLDEPGVGVEVDPLVPPDELAVPIDEEEAPPA